MNGWGISPGNHKVYVIKYLIICDKIMYPLGRGSEWFLRNYVFYEKKGMGHALGEPQSV